jgi:hypothetical protein
LGNVFYENNSFSWHNRPISTEFSNLRGRFVKARTIPTTMENGASFADFAGKDDAAGLGEWVARQVASYQPDA